MNDIYNYLDNRILLAYEYYYNRSNKCYNIKQINIEDTNDINNLKMIVKEDKIKFYINQIFNTSIKYIKKNNIKYIFKRNGVYYDTNIELSLYDDEDINKINNNKNEMMKFLLSEFLTYDQTKHLIIPIFNLDVKLKHLQLFLNTFNINEDINKLNNENNERYVKINITEHFYSQTYLNDFLNKTTDFNEMDLKVLLFQLIHTLSIIRTKYDGFSHNNLTLNNIFVYITEKNKSKRVYTFKNKIYEINNIGFDIKLDNFENSDLESYDTNDIIIFINSLKKNNNINNLINKNNKIDNFISNIINIKDPINIMNSNYFDDLLKVNKINKTKRLNNNNDSSELSESDESFDVKNTINGSRKVASKRSKKSKRSKSKKSKKSKRSNKDDYKKYNNYQNNNPNNYQQENNKSLSYNTNDYKKALNISNDEFSNLKYQNNNINPSYNNNMSISPDFNLLNNQQHNMGVNNPYNQNMGMFNQNNPNNQNMDLNNQLYNQNMGMFNQNNPNMSMFNQNMGANNPTMNLNNPTMGVNNQQLGGRKKELKKMEKRNNFFF